MGYGGIINSLSNQGVSLWVDVYVFDVRGQAGEIGPASLIQPEKTKILILLPVA